MWKVAQVYGSLLRAPVGKFIAQPCEKESQYLESVAEFLHEIEPSSILPASFLKIAILNEEKTKLFSRAFKNI